MKRKTMTNNQYYTLLNEMYEHSDIAWSDRKKYCQYYQNGNERYCKTTTQKSCKKCKMFTPDIHNKIRIVVENILEHEQTEYDLRMDNARKDGQIDMLRADFQHLRRYYDEQVRPYAAIGKSILRHRKKVARWEEN